MFIKLWEKNTINNLLLKQLIQDLHANSLFPTIQQTRGRALCTTCTLILASRQVSFFTILSFINPFYRPDYGLCEDTSRLA